MSHKTIQRAPLSYADLIHESALSCIKSAYDNGARWIVLCDTNGGTLPNEISETVNEVTKSIPGENLGIHAHNDTGNAVANSLAAASEFATAFPVSL